MIAEARQALEQGRAALAKREWAAARAYLESAIASHPSPEAYAALSDAAWWLHDEDAVILARQSAYKLYREAGNQREAARMAVWLASDSVEFRGEAATASGWLQRAHRLLAGQERCAEAGWLAVIEGNLALILRNDTGEAKRLGALASEIGKDNADSDLEMISLALEGLALVSEGQCAEGLRRLDEVATAALAGDIRDYIVKGTALCYVIGGCDRIRDYVRSIEWAAHVRTLSQAFDEGFLFSICRPHYAVALIWRGAWQEAEQELVEGIRKLNIIRPPMAAEGIVRLAELRWRQGRDAEAEELFARVEYDPLSLPGFAEIALDRGEPEKAIEFARRFLRQLPKESRLDRIPGLEALLRAFIQAGQLEEALPWLQELEDTAQVVRTEPLLASAAFAGGILRMAALDLPSAHAHLEDALSLFQRSGSAFETARTRLELARCLRALGRWADAREQATRGLQSLREMGALREAARAEALIRELAPAPKEGSPSASTPAGLTPREVEVLALVAQGKSNQEIAASLTLSVRTVERHISTIYSKIGADGKSGRAAVTAFAIRHRLIPHSP